ncbi:MAG: glycosyltransferase family 1 protein [Candidatus Komeilibacteria bacterium]|nr:glycosyltransferase family 1 protein [Candidatus Komeilibacteria bacterium]
MKINVDLRSLGYQPWSGVGYYTAALVKQLKSLPGVKWSFFDNRFSLNHQVDELIGSGAELFRYRIPNKFFTPLERFFNWPKFESLVNNPDLIWFPNLTFVNKKAANGKTKRIVTIHDCSFLIQPQWYPWKERLWHVLLAKKLTNYFDYFVAVSEHTKQEMIKLFNVPAEKIRVIYPGIEEKFFQTASNETLTQVKTKYLLPEKYFLFLGDVMKRKNVKLIIESLAKLKEKNQLGEYQIVIAGHIKDRSLINYVEKLGASSKVKFLGYVADEDRPALYQAAQAFIFPSLHEGFGFPVLEAAASKCPVICSQTTSLPELMGDNAIYVDPQNLESLTKTLTDFIQNPNKSDHLLIPAYERAREFTWSKTAQELYNYFKDIYENRC